MLYNILVRFIKNLNVLNIINTMLITCFCFCTEVFALPMYDQVTHGDVDFTQTAGEINALQINQHSDKAIVNWSSFNVAAQEQVHFQQPTNGVCLNRIDATNGMSQIDGSLSATGTIFLINQAGVLFGDNASINVGGLVASAIDIADQNFLESKLIFDQPGNMGGSIINRGLIKVDDHGLVALLGASVSDEGVIQANMSGVILASGDKMTLDFYGDKVMNFAIDAPTSRQGLDENGNPLQYAVNVSGQIINDAGGVLITARAAQGVFDNLINMSGVVRARSATVEDGLIILKADEFGGISVTGELDVSSMGENRGGLIHIFGEQLVLDDYAHVNVSGQNGAGYICIGCSNLFSVPDGAPFLSGVINAKNVYVGPNVRVNADSVTAGNGGQIVVSSDLETNFLGAATARGGALMGDGGQILVFSFGSSSYDGSKIDVNADNGQTGIFYDKILA